MRGNSDMHYGVFTCYINKEEGREVVHECSPLFKKRWKYPQEWLTAGGVKTRAKIDYLINEQSVIFKSLLMNSSMKFILALPFLVWMVKR